MSGQLIKILLGPFLGGMMMAFGAFHPHAEEELAEHGRQFGRFSPVTINGQWPFVVIAAFGDENLSHELIKWLVGAKRIAQPLVEKEDALDADAIRVRTQQIG